MTADEYMTRARRALASAKLLLADGDLDGACNRAYYAMFDAAHAALMWSAAQINPADAKTHRGLIAAFGKYLVIPGLFPAELGKSINQVERIRLLADYTGDEVDAERTQWAIDQAAVFIEAVQQIEKMLRPAKNSPPQK